jgi:hypothetical protein
MTRIKLAVVATLAIAGLTGCAGRTFDSLWTESTADAEARKAKAAAKEGSKEAAKPVDVSKFAETKGADGRIYVTISDAALKRAQAGQKPAAHKTAFGFGPKKETVIFEEDKDGKLADALMKAFEAKHGLAGKSM